MGLFCKGLHCAGCGKGIPASFIVLLGTIALLTNGKVQHAIVAALIIAAITVGSTAAITGLVISRIMASKVMVNGRWEGPMMAEVKAAAEWPQIEPGMAFHNGDPVKETIPISVNNDTWT